MTHPMKQLHRTVEERYGEDVLLISPPDSADPAGLWYFELGWTMIMWTQEKGFGAITDDPDRPFLSGCVRPVTELESVDAVVKHLDTLQND